MKVLILSLSDIHIKSDQDITDFKIDRLIKSLSTLTFERMCIVISGDITQSAKKREYIIARRFIGKLISKLTEKMKKIEYIDTIIVPGNHDINLNGNFTRDKIKTAMESDTLDDLFYERVNKMDNFFKYARNKKCFISNKIVDKKIFYLEDMNLKFNLINTALFSMFENDKGAHYIPEKEITRIKEPNKNEISITVMHHSPSWFLPDISNKLDKIIYNNSSFVFLGHEHDHTIKNASVNDGHKTEYISGGVFCDRLNSNRSEFYTVILDTENQIYDINFHDWCKDSQIYKVNSVKKKTKIKKPSLEPLPTFLEEVIKTDQKNNVSNTFENYYVFPTFEYTDNDGIEEKIKSFSSLYTKLKIYKKIHLVGEEDCGKTINLKKLYLKLIKEYKFCLFLDTDDLRSKKFDKMIRDAFEEQYSDKISDYQVFLQESNEQKVILIDNVHTVSEHSFKKLVDYLSDNFEYIIITSKEDWQFNIAKIAEKNYQTLSNFLKLKINKFYSDRRKLLIKKVLLLNEYSVNNDIDKAVNDINQVIQQNLRVFDLSPFFIIQYTTYLSNNRISGVKNNKIFSSVFESNLRKSIEIDTNAYEVDATFSALSRLAYYIHFEKEYPFSRSSVAKVIDNYNNEYGQNLDSKNFINSLIKARVFTEVDGEYLRFITISHLSFFVAREIIRHINHDGDYLKIEYILNNLCFGINADIAFFISYLTQSITVLNYIYESAMKFTRNWDKFEFDINKYDKLNSLLCQLEIEVPKDSIKKKYKENEVAYEKNYNSQLVIQDIYDYDTSEVTKITNKLKIAVKYTEIISKVLPSFDHEIKMDEKNKFIDATYDLPSRIIDKFLKYINGDIEELSRVIVSFFISEYNITEKEATIELKEFFTEVISGVIPGIYRNTAVNCTDRKTIKYYENHNSNNDAERIMDLFIKESAYLNDKFSSDLISLINKSDDILLRNILIKIARYHLISNDFISNSNRDKILSVFSNEFRKEFMIEKYKEKSK